MSDHTKRVLTGAVRCHGALLRLAIVGGLLTLSFGSLALNAAAQEQAVEQIHFPSPWGPYHVGVRTVFFEDSTRLDTLSQREGGFRPILVRVWYPSDSTTATPRPYMPAQVAAAWRGTMNAVAGFEAGVVTNSHANTPVSLQRSAWPLLLFSPGRSFPVENYQLALEQLASQGWIVAAISPPYEEALTLLPDGRTLPFAGPRWQDESERGAVLMSIIDEMTDDASLVIERLGELARTPGDSFEGRVDLDPGVGYLGHSLGGAAAAWTMQRDPRVTAALSWEGQVYRGVDRPLAVTGGDLLYIIGGANRTELAGTQFRPGAPGRTVHEVVIQGAWHASFGDMLHIYRRYADRGWLERHRRELLAERVNQITGDYAHEFFAHYLLGEPLDLLWPDSVEDLGDTSAWNYPEVEIRTYAY